MASIRLAYTHEIHPSCASEAFCVTCDASLCQAFACLSLHSDHVLLGSFFNRCSSDIGDIDVGGEWEKDLADELDDLQREIDTDI